MTAEGSILDDPVQSLEDAGLQDGDQLTAIVGHAKLAANENAFALLCSGFKEVVAWGNLYCGGDSSAAQHELRNASAVQATAHACGAILKNGSGVTVSQAQLGVT